MRDKVEKARTGGEKGRHLRPRLACPEAGKVVAKCAKKEGKKKKGTQHENHKMQTKKKMGNFRRFWFKEEQPRHSKTISDQKKKH